MSNYLATPYKTNDGNAPNVQAVPPHYIYAGPADGSDAVPTFRQLTSSDVSVAGAPTFSGFTPNGVAYASSSSSLGTTPAGARYQSLVSNATTPPTFQAVDLSQAVAVTGTLPVTKGGTGVTTATGTGSNVLSASPTFTGTIGAAALTLTTPLAVDSGGTGATTSTGTGSVVLSASPTFTGTIGAAALTLTTPLAVTSGGTGVTTSTGTGNNVLSASPTLTGTVNAGAMVLATPLPVASGGSGLLSTSQNYAFLGPLSGTGAPTWRTITSADVPAPGTAIFAGLTASGLAYASSSTTLATTSAGTQYQSMVANGTGAPTFQAVDLSQSAAVTGTLPVTKGGTGATTSTGTGNTVLSASPTFTGTIGAAALTLTTPLAVTSGGTGVTTSTGSGNNVLSANPTFGGVISGNQLSLSTPLATSSGGTGASTATGTGSNVLSISPTLTGTTNAGTMVLSTPLAITSGGSGLASTTQNYAFLGPLSGTGPPVWRAITAADIPLANNPTFSSFNQNGVAYANTTTTISTTSAGAQYQSLVANTAGTAPTFQAIDISQSAAVTGSLPVLKGGTGATTSTGTGSVVLSASPTFTGTIGAAALTLTTPLAVTSGGTGVTTSTGTGNNVLSANPSFGGVISGNQLSLSTPLATSSGGTGASTATGTGSNVLSISPTLTGKVTITDTTGTTSPLTLTSTVAAQTTFFVQNNNSTSTGKAEIGVQNGTNGLNLGQTGTANSTAASQSYLTPSANGLKITGNLSVGPGAGNAPGAGLEVKATNAGNGLIVENTNSAGSASADFKNNSAVHLYVGVGGSTIGGALQNKPYIQADGGVLLLNATQLIQPTSMHTVVTNWQGTGSAYEINSGSYVAYPLGAVGSYFFGPSGTTTNYGSLTVNPVTGGSGTTPYWLMPVAGIYSVKWRWTPSPYYNMSWISRNIGDGSERNNSSRGNPDILAFSWAYYFGGNLAAQMPAGLELTAEYYASTTDKIYFGMYEGNALQNTQQPQIDGDTSWMLRFTLIQRTG